MNVDLEAIAQRGRCEVSSLRLALPLIEQGYTPPFLSRYRRDELGGIDEASLWALSHAVESQKRLDNFRDDLHAAWQTTGLLDPAIGRAVTGAKSRRLLDRLSRRIKVETGEATTLAQKVAVRVMSPQKGDPAELKALAEAIQTESSSAEATAGDAGADQTADASAADTKSADTKPADAKPADGMSVETAMSKLDAVLAKRLCGDPRIIGSAVRWLTKHAKIHVVEVNDPHIDTSEKESEKAKPVAAEAAPAAEATPATEVTPTTDTTPVAAEAAEATSTPVTIESETASTETNAVAEASPEPAAEVPTADATVADASATEAPAEAPAASEVSAPASVEAKPDGTEAKSDVTEVKAESSETPAADAVESGESTPAEAAAKTSKLPPKAKGKKKEKAKPAKKKKMSPRQRRRRWLVSTLSSLAGKRMQANRLSSFQIVMLGRALRSQVAQCAFDYDAARLVAELQKTATNFNRNHGEHLAKILLENEAVIRDAAEGAWWDELQEQASAHLVSIAADNLHSQINRGGVEAKVVMSIDAVGPRTAATSIVAADGRILHNEDIPCQLSAAMRTMAVTKMGELIHNHHVDLIVISNGPSRRACMIAVGELIKQSGDQSIRWTLADRSGADAYAGSSAGDQEMRTTPRRFRSAAWIAFSTLQPSQALVKVDPLKLRLGSFQKELSETAMLRALDDVLVSGSARGGVDVNSTAVAWMQRLPGVTKDSADAIDKRRRDKLIESRAELLEVGQWNSVVQSRQAMPFLRVFKSAEPLDGTLIHPDDYELAKKLAKALEIELPPDCPPGYELPDYSEPVAQVVEEVSPPAASDSTATTNATTDPSSGDADGSVTETGDTASTSALEATPTSPESPAEVASPSDAAEPTADSVVETPEVAESSSEPAAAEENAASAEAEEAPKSNEPAGDAPVAEAPAAGETEATTDSGATDSGATDSATPAPAAAEASAPPAPEVHAPIRREKPERAKVEKLIKEWQVGVRRSRQIVEWLCEPFGEGLKTGTPPAVMTSMPALSELKQGDQVIGVVVGVMPFGVFVELSPECSGLVHVSRISDGYVEDLHEAVQVGDVITAWVTGIESKRRRVGLSAISPEREAELQTRRQNERSHGGSRGGRGGPPRGGNRDQQGQGRGGQNASSGQRGGPQRSGSASGGGQGGGGQGGGGQRGGQSRGGKPDGGRGKRSDGGRKSFDGNRRGGGGRRGPKKPEVYEVIGKEPDSAPISDAVKRGEEPMRSFGDLMQLFTEDKSPPKPTDVTPKKATSAPAAEQAANPPAPSPAATEPPASDAPPAAEAPAAAPDDSKEST